MTSSYEESVNTAMPSSDSDQRNQMSGETVDSGGLRSGLKRGLTLSSLQAEVGEWTSHNFPNAAAWEPLLGMGEELGELYHAFLKKHQAIRGSGEAHHKAMGDAIGDLLIYASHFANEVGLDIQSELEEAWAIVSQRDWKVNPETGIASG